MDNQIACILLAGGSGSRLQNEQPKQFVKIAGKTILEHSFLTLRHNMPHAFIIVVAPFEDVSFVEKLLKNDDFNKVIAGGTSRQASTFIGLKALSKLKPKNVMIHDAARPFLDGRIIRDVLDGLIDFEAIDVAISTSDTIIIERNSFIKNIPKRQHLLRGQTPQAFRYLNLLSCYEKLGEHRLDEFTDDCGIFINCNPKSKIKIIKGSEENFKITYPIDLILADEMFRLRSTSNQENKNGIQLRNKRVLIFGGTRGIGKAMSEIMTCGGSSVISRSRENGCDISQENDVRSAFNDAVRQLGGIDIVVNAAGTLKVGSLMTQSSKSIADLIAVNLTGALHVARCAYPHLKKSRGSLVLFASSSYTRGRADYVTYSATKAAIANLTQGLAEEWAADGIRVNCVVPSRTDTSMRTQNFSFESQDSLDNPYQVALLASKLGCGTLNGQLARLQ